MKKSTISMRQAQFTRTANTTNYAAGDAMGAGSATLDCIMEFPPLTSSEGTGKIRSARLWKSDTGVTNDGFTLLLFQRLPSQDPDDNAAPTTSFVKLADVGSYIGEIIFNTTGIVGADAVHYENTAIVAPLSGEIPFQSTDKDGKIYGILTAVGAYNPASAEVFTITLEIQE